MYLVLENIFLPATERIIFLSSTTDNKYSTALVWSKITFETRMVRKSSQLDENPFGCTFNSQSHVCGGIALAFVVTWAIELVKKASFHKLCLNRLLWGQLLCISVFHECRLELNVCPISIRCNFSAKIGYRWIPYIQLYYPMAELCICRLTVTAAQKVSDAVPPTSIAQLDTIRRVSLMEIWKYARPFKKGQKKAKKPKSNLINGTKWLKFFSLALPRLSGCAGACSHFDTAIHKSYSDETSISELFKNSVNWSLSKDSHSFSQSGLLIISWNFVDNMATQCETNDLKKCKETIEYRKSCSYGQLSRLATDSTNFLSCLPDENILFHIETKHEKCPSRITLG